MKIMQKIKGTLIPIGGNEDKGVNENEMYSLEFIDEGILFHVLKEAGGIDANIVIIPTASSIPAEVGENYIDAFTKLGCKNISVLDIRSAEDSEKPANIASIKKADCLMFSGGDQSKITNKIGGSTIHDIIIDRYKNPLNQGTLDPHDISFEDDNPICGDHIRIDIRVGEDGRVNEAVFDGEAIVVQSSGKKTGVNVPVSAKNKKEAEKKLIDKIKMEQKNGNLVKGEITKIKVKKP